jgi:hypothetical protein
MKDNLTGWRAGVSRLGRLSLDALIVLAVFFTLAEQALIVANVAWRWRIIASWTCAVLDILFTILAAYRTAKNLAEGSFRAYFRRGTGWIDLLSSILPLVFTSGPFLFDTSSGLTATSTIMALGNFRILRGLGLLRSLRLLTLFRHREITRMATLALVSSLAVFILAEGASLAGLWPDAHEALTAKRGASLLALEASPGADGADTIARVDQDLLLVRRSGKVVYTRYSSEEYQRRFGPDEIGYLRGEDGTEAFFSLKGELRAEAAAALISGLSALAVLSALGLGSIALRRREEREAGKAP